jgi:hypothetical protein
MRAVGVVVVSIGLSWADVASAQVAAVKGETDSVNVARRRAEAADRARARSLR